MPCDYNGRKITVNSVTGISVGYSFKPNRLRWSK